MCTEVYRSRFLSTPRAKTTAGKRGNKRGRIEWKWLPGKPVVLIKNSQTSMWLLSAAGLKDDAAACHRNRISSSYENTVLFRTSNVPIELIITVIIF